ncbi:hypothetical protein AB1286_14095 [Trinickia sp. NRRL B-1857]|uniref:hypothetical protein n=1 Tax=Trinickia sp. NRRL B-1857 TaxID=3162879 RepID=UPI003D2E9A67
MNKILNGQNINCIGVSEGIGGDRYAGFSDPLSACWQLGPDSYRVAFGDLVAFMNGVLYTDQLPFRIDVESGRKEAIPVVVEGRRGLAGFFQDFTLLMRVYYPEWTYSPDLALFFDCYLRHPEFGDWPSCFPKRGLANEKIAAEAYNEFIAELRYEARSRKVRRKLKKWKNGLVAQERSIRKKLYLATQGQGRLIPLRMEFFYAESAAVIEDALPRFNWHPEPHGTWSRVPYRFGSDVWAPEARPRIDAGLAMQHRERFFDNQRGVDATLFDAMVVYITKMENGGQHRANHFHVLFLFEAQRLKKSDLDRLRNLAADRWRRVTGGLGLSFDCRDRSDVEQLRRQRKWALDPLDCSDEQQFNRLVEYVVGYFAKDEDQMVRTKPTKRARTLTMGVRKPEVLSSTSQTDEGIWTGSPAVPAKPASLSI